VADGLRELASATLDEPRDAHAAAARTWLDRHAASRTIDAIAHRVVHGGDVFTGPVRVTRDVITTLGTLVALAPNHLPAEIAMIEAFMRERPDVPQVACFDTAFHATMPAVARTLPLPGVRRFGFHGLSYAYLIGELGRVAGPDAAAARVILAHLGSGASLAAVHHGQSVDTTMGMTPTGGLVMSTRSGDLDPSAVMYVMRQQHLSVDAMDTLLTTGSGLREISQRTGDMKALLALAPTDAAARLAVDVFCYQAAKSMAAMAAALGGVDTIVFSGGIGERSADIRARIADRLAFLGVTLDAGLNGADSPVISTPDARVVARVIATNEAQVMAAQAHDLLAPVDPETMGDWRNTR
jgi:acetate kinase